LQVDQFFEQKTSNLNYRTSVQYIFDLKHWIIYSVGHFSAVDTV